MTCRDCTAACWPWPSPGPGLGPCGPDRGCGPSPSSTRHSDLLQLLRHAGHHPQGTLQQGLCAAYDARQPQALRGSEERDADWGKQKDG
jgi:hypothetical protein